MWLNRLYSSNRRHKQQQQPLKIVFFLIFIFFFVWNEKIFALFTKQRPTLLCNKFFEFMSQYEITKIPRIPNLNFYLKIFTEKKRTNRRNNQNQFNWMPKYSSIKIAKFLFLMAINSLQFNFYTLLISAPEIYTKLHWWNFPYFFKIIFVLNFFQFFF